MTLGFGTTLIGESVDYAIYYLIQARGGPGAAARWRTASWPTIRLGLCDVVDRLRGARLHRLSRPGAARRVLDRRPRRGGGDDALRLSDPGAERRARRRLSRTGSRTGCAPQPRTCRAGGCSSRARTRRGNRRRRGAVAVARRSSRRSAPVGPPSSRATPRCAPTSAPPTPARWSRVAAPNEQGALEARGGGRRPARQARRRRRARRLRLAGAAAAAPGTQARRRAALPDAETLRARLDEATAGGPLPARGSRLRRRRRGGARRAADRAQVARRHAARRRPSTRCSLPGRRGAAVARARQPAGAAQARRSTWRASAARSPTSPVRASSRSRPSSTRSTRASCARREWQAMLGARRRSRCSLAWHLRARAG